MKWTPEGLKILGTASDGEYRTAKKVMSQRTADSRTRECWLTESDKCVKLTWNADAQLMPGNLFLPNVPRRRPKLPEDGATGRTGTGFTHGLGFPVATP